MSLTELLKQLPSGKLVGGEPDDEAKHFYDCDECGQSVDKRNLSQVFHHEDPGHKPHEVNS